MIGDRTRQALDARKSQGANPRNASEAAELGRGIQKVDADEFAAKVLPIIEAMRKTGIRRMVSIAAALNSRGVRTMRGGRWHVSTVQNVLRRTHRLFGLPISQPPESVSADTAPA